MRPLSLDEIDQLLGSLAIYENKRLQTVAASRDDVVLGFWEGRRILWLWLDCDSLTPALIPSVDLPLSLPKKHTPLQLFIKAHLLGSRLLEMRLKSGEGRVVHLIFDKGEIEFRLIPRATNVIVKSQDKSVSLRPPLELAPHSEPSATKMRSLPEYIDEWKSKRLKAPNKKTPKQSFEQKIKGVERSIEKVAQEIALKQQSPYRLLGEWLAKNQTLNVPEEFQTLVDQRRKLSWNIEHAFEKAKENERKLEGTRERKKELEGQLVELKARLAQGNWVESETPKTKKANPARGRTLSLGTELQIVVGKSAKDNLGLLRRARAWDLWMHIKDVPSAHGILSRPKQGKVSDAMLTQASHWLIKNSLGQKYRNHIGEKFEILVTECRFVSPIKGDRLGRVNYRNERVLRIRFEEAP